MAQERIEMLAKLQLVDTLSPPTSFDHTDIASISYLRLCLSVECNTELSELLRATAHSLWFYQRLFLLSRAWLARIAASRTAIGLYFAAEYCLFFNFMELISQTQHHRCPPFDNPTLISEKMQRLPGGLIMTQGRL